MKDKNDWWDKTGEWSEEDTQAYKLILETLSDVGVEYEKVCVKKKLVEMLQLFPRAQRLVNQLIVATREDSDRYWRQIVDAAVDSELDRYKD